MNYELDTYVDALKDFPSKEIQLETQDNVFYHFKSDTFKGMMSYSTSPTFAANITTISTQRAKDVIAMNKKGVKPETLEERTEENSKPVRTDYDNVVGQDSLTRFDTQKKKPIQNQKHNGKKGNRPQNKENVQTEQVEKKAPLLIKKKDNPNT